MLHAKAELSRGENSSGAIPQLSAVTPPCLRGTWGSGGASLVGSIINITFQDEL